MSIVSSIKGFFQTRDELSLNNVRKELWAVIIVFPMSVILANMRHINLDIEFAGFQSFELMLYLWGFGWLVLAFFPKRFIIPLLKIAAVISAILLLLQILFTADIPSHTALAVHLPGTQLFVFTAYMFFNGICCACAFFIFSFNLNNVERLSGLILLILYHSLDFSIIKSFPSFQNAYEIWGAGAVMAVFLVVVFLLNKKTEEIIIVDDKNKQTTQDNKDAKVGIIIPLHIVYFSTMLMIHYLEPAGNIIFSLPYGLGQFTSIILIVLIMVLLNRNSLYIWLFFLVFTLFGLAIVNYNSVIAHFLGSLIFGTGDGLGYIITIYLCAGAIKKSKSIKMYRLYCFILFVEYVFISGIKTYSTNRIKQ